MVNVAAAKTLIDNLNANYNQVLNNCYTNIGTNLVMKAQLDDNDKMVFLEFANGTHLINDPDIALNDLYTAASQLSIESVYTADLTLLQDRLPFEHQVYPGMYDLFNKINSLRVSALYFKKERQAFLFLHRIGSETNIPFSQWMTSNLIECTPGLNSTVSYINSDVANNEILLKMATLLTNTVATNQSQRLAYLGGLINTNYTFAVPPNYWNSGPQQVLPSYKVLNNADGRNYLIVKQANAIAFAYQLVEDAQPFAAYTLRTGDGRYQLAYDTGDLAGLLQGNTGNDPFGYLSSISSGGLTNLTQANGILLARTQSPEGANQELYLLDAQAYNANVFGDQYLRFGGTTNGPLVKMKDVVAGTSFPFNDGAKALNNAGFLNIYYDTHIRTSGTMATNAAGWYVPSDETAMPAMFSLDDGDVLDLSLLSGLLEKTIRICGNATIVGGGPSMTISNLKIESYGGSLTISNLFLSSSSNIINNVNDLVLVVTGSNSFQSALVTAYGYNTSVIGGGGGGGGITISGPGTLVVKTTSTTMPAILSGGSIIVNGASNLIVSAQGATSMYNGDPIDELISGHLFIVDSKVTSHVGVESDNEFAASMVTLGNSVLDMSYGTINPNLISPCVWLGAVRGVSQVSVKTDSANYSGTGANIYLRIEGTNGATKYYNIKTLAGGDGDFQDGKTAEFRMSYSVTNTGGGNFQGLGVIQFIQLYEDNSGSSPDWHCDWVNIAPNVVGDVPTAYQFAVAHNFNGASDVQTVSAVEQNNPYTYTINPDHATVTINHYAGSNAAVIVPSTIHGYAVTDIGPNAFYSNENLVSVTIPSSVTNIGSTAFHNCYGMMGVYFQGLPPNLIYNNNESPFYGDDFTAVYYLPENAWGWGSTFSGLPTALWTPFYYTINPDNTVAITGYSGLGGTVVIPGMIEGLPVTSLASNAFYACADITCVSIPNSVTNIGSSAFFGCANLTGVYFQGDAPGQVGANVFNGDTGATVYHFAVTANWPAVPGAWYDRPTALWLDVINGTDGSCYTNLQQVVITANAPAPGAVFAQWTGTTQYLASVTAASTTVSMPLQPVTLTATYYYAPSITTQPAGKSVINGFNATFSVTAGGTAPLAYQWYFNTNAIGGATATNYTISGVTSNDAGGYTVEVTNLYGSVTSSVAVLAVLYPPFIATSPTSQVVALGGTVNLSVSTTGQGPLSFQWFKNGGMISGATNNTLTLASAGVQDSGVYYVVVTNACGLKISLPATVTVGVPQLLAWGNNVYGQLGDGTTTNRSNAVCVTSNVVAATAGEDHSLFVKADGSLWAMGRDNCGQLGDGTIGHSDSPECVASNVAAVAAGGFHSLYLKGDGTLWTMGDNDCGQLGVGTIGGQSDSPVSVASNVTAVSAGLHHSLFLKEGGALWGMGDNEYGELGDGTTTQRGSPVPVSGLSLANVISGCNADHSLAVGLLLEKPTFTLTIQPTRGSASPAVGVYTNIAATILTNTMSSPDERGATQFVCAGWVMTGNTPMSGQTNRMVMTITNDAVLTWLWTTNYWLATAHGTNGSVNVGTGWQPSGATTQITATANQYFHFANWGGDATGASNPLELLMDAPKSVTANFAANMTTNQPTPEWWLAQYGISNNFEQAVLNDPDRDGMATYAEYLAGTDPTNRNSVLAFSGVAPELNGTGMVISWQGVEGKLYSLARGTNLTDVAPFGQHVSTNIPGVSPMNTETDKTAVGTGQWFYRIELE